MAQALQDVDITVDPDNGVVISGGPAETRFVTLRTLGEGATVYVPQGLAAPYATGAALAGAMLVEYHAGCCVCGNGRRTESGAPSSP